MVRKLEVHIMLNIPAKIVSEVGDAIETVEKLRIKLDWIKRILTKVRDVVN